MNTSLSRAQQITRDGEKEENNFVIHANSDINQDNPIWNFFIENQVIKSTELKYLCMIKCTTHQYSELAGSSVKPKSDAFIAIANKELFECLKSYNYLITESEMNALNLIPVKSSGISIKKSAKTIQIQKLSANSFEKFLGIGKDARCLGAGVSLYVQKENEFEKNVTKVLLNWEITVDEFGLYFDSFLPGVSRTDIFLYSNKENLSKIKKYSKEQVKKLIQDDQKKLELVFTGKHNFQDPYIAYWICEDSILSKNSFKNFSIDAGSGRKTIDIGRVTTSRL